jgi:hypothetical protein
MGAMFIVQPNCIRRRWVDRRMNGFGLPGSYFPIGMLVGCSNFRDGRGHGYYLSRFQGRLCDSAATVWGGLYRYRIWHSLLRPTSPNVAPNFGAAGLPHSHDAPASGDHQIQNACRSVKPENEWSNIYTNNVNRHAIECQGSKTG